MIQKFKMPQLPSGWLILIVMKVAFAQVLGIAPIAGTFVEEVTIDSYMAYLLKNLYLMMIKILVMGRWPSWSHR